MATTFNKFSDLSYGVLGADIDATQTSFAFATGAKDFGTVEFVLTIGEPGADGNYPDGSEQVLVTEYSGLSVSECTRSYGGTTAPVDGWPAGTKVQRNLVASELTAFATAINNIETGATQIVLTAPGEVGTGTPNKGKFTTLEATGIFTAGHGSNAIVIGAFCTMSSPPAIGAVAPNSGKFTTGQFTDKLTTLASASGKAGFIVPPGTAPSSPVNGDFWSTSAGFYGQVNGATVGPFIAAASPGNIGTGTPGTGKFTTLECTGPTFTTPATFGIGAAATALTLGAATGYTSIANAELRIAAYDWKTGYTSATSTTKHYDRGMSFAASAWYEICTIDIGASADWGACGLHIEFNGATAYAQEGSWTADVFVSKTSGGSPAYKKTIDSRGTKNVYNVKMRDMGSNVYAIWAYGGAGCAGSIRVTYRELINGLVSFANFGVAGSGGSADIAESGTYSFGTPISSTSAAYPAASFTRTGTGTNAAVPVFRMVAQTSGDMGDGYGSLFQGEATDNGAANKVFGGIAFVRDSADTEGAVKIFGGTNGADLLATFDHLGELTVPALTVDGLSTFTGGITINGSSTFGNEATDEIAVHARMMHRVIANTSAAGTTAEIAFCSADAKFYGCTNTGDPATWVALH